jgi:pimeloyl-ACP methyl ester carboxylesterase
MKIIFVPGFWDSPDKFNNLVKIFSDLNIDFQILDYRDYKKFGKTLDRETFSMIISEMYGNNPEDCILLSFSMGASFVYDYLSGSDIKPAKLIFINPLMESIENPVQSSYLRVLDMHLQKQLLTAVSTSQKGLIPLAGVALLQQSYNKKIKFDKKLDVDATFIWGEKDLICPITNYQKYKTYFNETKLITVPNHHHNWLIYDDPVKQYLLCEINQ